MCVVLTGVLATQASSTPQTTSDNNGKTCVSHAQYLYLHEWSDALEVAF